MTIYCEYTNHRLPIFNWFLVRTTKWRLFNQYGGYMKVYIIIFLLTASLLAPQIVLAAPDRLANNDASQVQFTVNASGPPTYVYFRNFDSFGAGWLGCCGPYFIDISTEGGKAQFYTFLAAYLSKQKIVIYVEKNGGAILQIGNF